jgi:hypothetical protein
VAQAGRGPGEGHATSGVTTPTLATPQISEIIFVSICTSEFFMKVYVDPLEYWKDGYNVLDVVIVIIIFIPYILCKIKGRHYRYLNMADGLQSLRILKLITYSRGIRVSAWGWHGVARAGCGATCLLPP